MSDFVLPYHTGNKEVNHGHYAGGGGTQDEAFETGFVDFRLLVHKLRGVEGEGVFEGFE